MTLGPASEDRRTLRPYDAGPADTDRARRTVEALERLRAQLTHTQGVLDDYLERLEEHTGDARSATNG